MFNDTYNRLVENVNLDHVNLQSNQDQYRLNKFKGSLKKLSES